MHWHVFAIGKPKLGFARDGIEEYATRLRPLAAVTIDYLKPAAGEEESTALLRRSEGMYRVALDERGAQFTSRDLAAKVGQWEQDRIKDIALLIGGADGHSPALRAKAPRDKAPRGERCPCLRSAARIGSAACAELSPLSGASSTHSH